MKKMMTLMLGLSLVMGTAAFAQDKSTDTTKTEKKSKKKSKKGDTDTMKSDTTKK